MVTMGEVEVKASLRHAMMAFLMAMLPLQNMFDLYLICFLAARRWMGGTLVLCCFKKYVKKGD